VRQDAGHRHAILVLVAFVLPGFVTILVKERIYDVHPSHFGTDSPRVSTSTKPELTRARSL
jgi:hypothetical protein